MSREASSQPRLRYDVTTNDWVLFAPARTRRPHAETPTRTDATPDRTCPFCPGNEHLTPGEVLRVEDGTGWCVRVVPNKYPALDPNATSEQRELGPVFRERGGYGFHEVVIESPDHSRPLSQQPIEQVERVLRVLHTRFTTLMKQVGVRAIVVFKNQGERAGTSLSHPHWQIIATPVVPRLLRLEHAIAMDYFDRTSKCLYCVALEEELRAGARVIAANEDYVAVAPYASHVPYQVRILPREHHSSFAGASIERLRPLGEILRTVLLRIEAVLDAPDFNLTLGTAALGDEEKRYFLWHVDVLPRLATPAGFELGSGMSINPVLPEEAADALRMSRRSR